MTSNNDFILQDLSDDLLDQILSLAPESKTIYFLGLTKEYYPDIEDGSEYQQNIIESYISSYYIEKMYRSNRFFNEKFSPVYTKTGLIRNVWCDLFFIDDDLIVH